MSDEKKTSKTEKLGRFAIDATKLAFNLTRDVVEEITKDTKVEMPHKPENVSRSAFVRNVKPMKTYTNASRKVHIFQTKPKEQIFRKNKPKPFFAPANDGLVSFALLLAPFAFIIGLLVVSNILSEWLAFFLLFLYIMFVAIPGAYLGMNAVVETSRLLMLSGGQTIRMFFEIFVLIFRGLIELFVLTITWIWSLIARYWIFCLTYTISCLLLYYGILTLLPAVNISSLSRISLLVLLPALFPAAFAHRWWIIWEYRKQYFAN